MTIHKSLAALAGLLLAGAVLAADMTDQEVRAQVVLASVAGFPGFCPCPGSIDADGYACGSRSVWSKTGGKKVTCHPRDVTADQIREFRARHPS